MSRTVVVCGPMGCGKTHNAEALRRHFNCARVQDSWTGQEAVRPGSLVLTYLTPREARQIFPGSGPLIVEFGFAMHQMGRSK